MPIGVSSQDRLMSTSYRYEVNKGKSDNISLRMQQTAQVKKEKEFLVRVSKILNFFYSLSQNVSSSGRRTLLQTAKRTSRVDIYYEKIFDFENNFRINSRNKYRQFKATWAEKSAWSTIGLKEASEDRQRNQELLLLRRAHITVGFLLIFENV